MNSITIITPGYPTTTDPYYPFVQQLAEEMAEQGLDVTVIAPQSVTHTILHGLEKHPRKRVDSTRSGRIIKVFQPYYLTIPYKFKKINGFLFSCAIKFRLRGLSVSDVYYAHFWQTGYNAYRLIKKFHRPLFIATGESEIKKMISFPKGPNEFSDYVKGVVAVSSKNKEESIRLGLTVENKCTVFPNAIDNTIFYKRDKIVCRSQLGIPQDAFIVAFVGWFIERKGPMRVSGAIKKIGNVNSFFIGKGEQTPDCEGILFKGSLPHNKIPLYLSAADVFVLPTLNEGCCNAVIEAMACGLPIISSNLPFNWDVLDDSNSILVDPNNIDEIADAIKTLKEDISKKKMLAEGGLKKAESLTIDRRAEGILKFIADRIN